MCNKESSARIIASTTFGGKKFFKIAKKRIGQNFHEKNCFVSSVRVSPQNLFRFGQNLSCSDKLSSIILYFAEKQGLFLPLISTNFAQTTTFRQNFAGSAQFAKTGACASLATRSKRLSNKSSVKKKNYQ